MMQQMLLGLGGSGPGLLISELFKTYLYTGNGSVGNQINNGINIGDSSVSLNGKTITDTTGGGADYSKLNNNIISSNNTDYYYNAAGNIDCYIDYGSAVVSGFYNLYPQGDASQSPPIVYNSPQSVTGYGSNNASSWTSLGTATFDISDWLNGQPTKAVFTNETAYRYYRLEVAGNGKTLQEWHLGIGQAGRGGLVWLKNRNNGYQDNALFDTERGAGQVLNSASTNGQFLSTGRFGSFNSNGFTVNQDSATNQSGQSIVSWTFCKAPGFFDIVTYTGNGVSGRTVAHNLGSVPGAIIVKKVITGGGTWPVWHRSISTGTTNRLLLNEFENAQSSSTFTTTAPTSSVFTVGSSGDTNNNNTRYVAYVFAHEDASFGESGTDTVIKCDSYIGTGTNSSFSVNCGFKPGWVLIKTTNASGETTNASNSPWVIIDNQRGTAALYPNNSIEENGYDGGGYGITFTSTGFNVASSNSAVNYGGSRIYAYIAIREP